MNAVSGRYGRIPPQLEAELAALYLEPLRLLAGRFGQPVEAWLGRAERAKARTSS